MLIVGLELGVNAEVPSGNGDRGGGKVGNVDLPGVHGVYPG